MDEKEKKLQKSFHGKKIEINTLKKIETIVWVDPDESFGYKTQQLQNYIKSIQNNKHSSSLRFYVLKKIIKALPKLNSSFFHSIYDYTPKYSNCIKYTKKEYLGSSSQSFITQKRQCAAIINFYPVQVQTQVKEECTWCGLGPNQKVEYETYIPFNMSFPFFTSDNKASIREMQKIGLPSETFLSMPRNVYDQLDAAGVQYLNLDGLINSLNTLEKEYNAQFHLKSYIAGKCYL